MKNIKLYYFKRALSNGNFGDELNTLIPHKLFNTEIEHVSQERCEAIFIGSILSIFLKEYLQQKTTPVKVWGSGFIRDLKENDKLYRNVEVYALRGKKTLYDLERLTHHVYTDICLGDPGLLLSRCYNNLDFTKKYKYGIIPHYVDANDENLKKIKLKNSIVININDPVDTIVKQIVSCEYILSSAMHGLIAADSFGIPNIRFIASYKLTGDEYKFDDYYSAFDMKQPQPIDLRKLEELNDISFDYKISQQKVKEIQEKLIRSFPYV